MADLVLKAAAGDTVAFELLYRQRCVRVHAVCLRMTRDVALAEDCTQEAFIRAWRAPSRFEARSSFGTWLHRIAVNIVLARRRRPLPAVEFVDELPDDASEVALPDTPVEKAELGTAIAALPQGARDGCCATCATAFRRRAARQFGQRRHRQLLRRAGREVPRDVAQQRAARSQ